MKFIKVKSKIDQRVELKMARLESNMIDAESMKGGIDSDYKQIKKIVHAEYRIIENGLQKLAYTKGSAELLNLVNNYFNNLK